MGKGKDGDTKDKEIEPYKMDKNHLFELEVR